MKLLCTDLDRTLVPNGEQPESALARPVLWHLLRSNGVALAYVSGRDLVRVLAAIDDFDLQKPDVIVADVGTSIYVPIEGGWQLQDEWQSQIGRDWNGFDSEGIREHLASFSELEDQEEDRQTRFKRSYYLPRDLNANALRQRLDDHLTGLGVQASLVFSDDPEKGIQLLDVLPRHATKIDAIRHVQNMLDVENHLTLFSGDSGNDVTALASTFPSVTVRNADAPTRNAVRLLAAQNATESTSYQAEGGLALAGGHELNGHYAAGIVEGLLHFNDAWADSLKSPDWVKTALDLYGPAGKPKSVRA